MPQGKSERGRNKCPLGAKGSLGDPPTAESQQRPRAGSSERPRKGADQSLFEGECFGANSHHWQNSSTVIGLQDYKIPTGFI